MFDFTGNIARVTGATSGIGAAISETLAGAEAMVFFADQDEAGADTQTKKLAAVGARVRTPVLNVTVGEDCIRARLAYCTTKFAVVGFTKRQPAQKAGAESVYDTSLG